MTNLEQISHMRNSAWTAFLCFALFAAFALVPEFAFADDQLSEGFCNAIAFVTGRTGKALATIAIITVGVGALMGKVSWGLAILVALGIAIIFGAEAIMGAISGDAGTGCA